MEKGFADAAVSGIADAAGVTKSLIHHHFGSREALWGEVEQHRFAEYAEVQGRILDDFEHDAEPVAAATAAPCAELSPDGRRS